MLSRVGQVCGHVARRTAVRMPSSSRLASARASSAVAAAAAASATALAYYSHTTDCMSLAEFHEAPAPTSDAAAALQRMTADGEWIRVDSVLLRGGGEGHVIFDTLGAQANAVPMYRIFSRPDGSETVSIATLGAAGCDGHKGIVHGGVTAMLLDNTLGWANAVHVLASGGELEATLEGRPIARDTVSTFGMTAYLNLNYRAPCRAGTTVVITCRLERAEGRKRFLKGEVRDAASGALIAEATSLFVRPRPKE